MAHFCDCPEVNYYDLIEPTFRGDRLITFLTALRDDQLVTFFGDDEHRNRHKSRFELYLIDVYFLRHRIIQQFPDDGYWDMRPYDDNEFALIYDYIDRVFSHQIPSVFLIGPLIHPYTRAFPLLFIKHFPMIHLSPAISTIYDTHHPYLITQFADRMNCLSPHLLPREDFIMPICLLDPHNAEIRRKLLSYLWYGDYLFMHLRRFTSSEAIIRALLEPIIAKRPEVIRIQHHYVIGRYDELQLLGSWFPNTKKYVIWPYDKPIDVSSMRKIYQCGWRVSSADDSPLQALPFENHQLANWVAIAMCLGTGELRLKEEVQNDNQRRFLSIVSRIPFGLQLHLFDRNYQGESTTCELELRMRELAYIKYLF